MYVKFNSKKEMKNTTLINITSLKQKEAIKKALKNPLLGVDKPTKHQEFIKLDSIHLKHYFTLVNQL